MQVYCRPLLRDGLVTVLMQHHYSRENPAPGWLTLPPTQPQPTPEQSTYHLSQDQPAPDHTPLNLTHLPVQMTVLRALTEVNYLSKMCHRVLYLSENRMPHCQSKREETDQILHNQYTNQYS